ncbi:hypothetical protein [Variovorax sp. PBL-H6]|uniref:hypothetical protein n=1 Tax=Variovorax sp. PBL-H6 TaxID=434009 RepID=UPI0013A5667B|nr:hypothetical protein [Variovorax sp. PBL-H6]
MQPGARAEFHKLSRAIQLLHLRVDAIEVGLRAVSAALCGQPGVFLCDDAAHAIEGRVADVVARRRTAAG